MPESSPTPPAASASPDYAGLVEFLLQPLLDSPEALRVDCERYGKQRVLVRVAFEQSDKGRAFGRGGRNIQAIRTVVQAAARAAGQSAHLEVYGQQASDAPAEGGRRGARDRRRPSRPERRQVR